MNTEEKKRLNDVIETQKLPNEFMETIIEFAYDSKFNRKAKTKQNITVDKLKLQEIMVHSEDLRRSKDGFEYGEVTFELIINSVSFYLSLNFKGDQNPEVNYIEFSDPDCLNIHKCNCSNETLFKKGCQCGGV